MGGISDELRAELIEKRIQQSPEHIQLEFWAMIADGATPVFAEMAAMQSAPLMLGSDRTFNEGSRATMEEKMKGGQMPKIIKMAQKAGINTQGKYYKGGLGRPTDPMAWVSTTDDVLEVCRKKNLNCEGVVKHKAVEKSPPKKKKLAKNLVDRYVAQEVARNPKSAELVKAGKRKAVEEKVIAKHAKSR